MQTKSPDDTRLPLSTKSTPSTLRHPPPADDPKPHPDQNTRSNRRETSWQNIIFRNRALSQCSEWLPFAQGTRSCATEYQEGAEYTAAPGPWSARITRYTPHAGYLDSSPGIRLPVIAGVQAAIMPQDHKGLERPDIILLQECARRNANLYCAFPQGPGQSCTHTAIARSSSTARTRCAASGHPTVPRQLGPRETPPR